MEMPLKAVEVKWVCNIEREKNTLLTTLCSWNRNQQYNYKGRYQIACSDHEHVRSSIWRKSLPVNFFLFSLLPTHEPNSHLLMHTCRLEKVVLAGRMLQQIASCIWCL